MEYVEKVGYPQLTAGETVEALGLFLDNLPFKANIYWPKNYQVNLVREDDDLHFQIMVAPRKLYVGGLKISTVDGCRKVSLTFNHDIQMTPKQRVDHIKTALRRMIVAVAYRDYSHNKLLAQGKPMKVTVTN
jgi:hypothetical protein